MSPPGIAMLYASEDAETALRETADREGSYALGEFQTLRAVRIVDLTKTPDVPSIVLDVNAVVPFDGLCDFACEVGKEAEPLPKPRVFVLVRTALRDADGSPLMGIRYRSSRHEGGASLVLFVNQGNVEPTPGEETPWSGAASDTWIRLVGADERALSTAEIAGWNREFSAF